MISIDYETFLISNENIFPKPVCLSWYDGSNTGLLNRAEADTFLRELLTSNEEIIAHNAVFECGVTIVHYPDLAQLVFDALDNNLIYCTKINEALWNIQREKPLNRLDLASLVKHYFQVDISASKTADAWRLRYSELDNVPISEYPIEASQYAIDDSIWAAKIRHLQKPIDQSLALKSAVYLNLMGANGFNIEQSRVLQLEAEILEFLNPRYDFLRSEGFVVFNKKGTNSKRVKLFAQYLVDLGIDLQYTDKGGVSTAADSLDAYKTQSDDPILKAFSELSKYEKILSAYINHMKGAPKIYTQYSTTKNTGRTSSSGSKLFDSMNIQQMPRAVENVTYDIRNCYKARPGFKVVSIDYSGLELCSAAHQLYKTLGYSYMREALNEGGVPADLHSRLAAKIKGVTYDDFMSHKKELEYKDARQKAKPINLGFPGGIGYDTMRYLMWRDGIKTQYNVLETSKRKSDIQYYLFQLAAPDMRMKRLNKYEYALVQDELVLLKKYMFELYPDLEQFLKDTHNRFLTGKVKRVKNEFDEWEDEPMYMYDIYGFKRDNCTYTALCNGFLMQTPSAIGAQKAMCLINREYFNHPDVVTQAFIHDECIVEIREEYAQEHVKHISEMLIDGMHSTLSSVRITVEAEVCGDYWRKAGGEWSKTYWKDTPGGVLNEAD